MAKHGVTLEEIRTEKQMYSELGFSERKHCPDFVIEKGGKKSCVEVELTLKAKPRLEKITEENYLAYDTQYWVVANTGYKIRKILNQLSEKYQNIEIKEIKEIEESARNNK